MNRVLLTRFMAAGFALATVVVAVPAGAGPLPPTIDTSFATDGSTKLTGFGHVKWWALQATDTNYYVTGNTALDGRDLGIVARYNLDGTLDSTFSGDGVVTLAPKSTEGRSRPIVTSVAVQSAGAVMLAARDTLTGDVLVVRLKADGARDTSFGTHGVQFFHQGKAGFFPSTAVDTDDRVSITYSRYLVSSKQSEIVVRRFDPDGVADPTWGPTSNGVAVTHVGPGTEVWNAATDSQGRVLVGGYIYRHRTFKSFVVRVDAGGADPTFGADGVVYATLADRSTEMGGVMVDAQDRVLAALGSGQRLGVARWTVDGTPDPTYGGDGVSAVRGSFGASSVYWGVLTPDGVVLASHAWKDPAGIVLTRFEKHGGLDPFFGVDGEGAINIYSKHDTAYMTALDATGRLVIAANQDQSEGPGFLTRVLLS